MSDESSFKRPLSLLRDYGFTPGAIIDIGVADGTPQLYDVWPDAPLCLVEPSPNAHARLEAFVASRPGVQLFRCGASDREGEVEVTEAVDRPYVAFGGHKPKWQPTTVRIRRCDDIVREAGLQGPFVYKLDTDSHDWEALHGSDETLAQTAVVVIELNVYNRFRGMATPDQIWRFLTDRGFTFFDIGDGGYGSRGMLRCMDFIFIHAEHPLFRTLFEQAGKLAGFGPGTLPPA